MDDIDDTTTILAQLHDDSKKKQQQLSMITKPFQNLNLVHEHGERVGMVVTGKPANKIPQVFNLTDPDYEVPEVKKWWRKPQNPNTKTHRTYGTSRYRNVSQVPTKDVIGYRVPMTTKEELDVWKKFLERAERDNWPARRVGTRNDEVVLDHGEPIVLLLARFAVDTYNAICLKAGVSNGVRMTSILEFKYIKWGEIYANYITIEAACPYTGINCNFEALVQTLPSDGRKTLVNFHRERGWHPFGIYSHSDSDSDDHELAEKKECEEVARWNELKEQRLKELKAAVSPSGSGLKVDYVLGSYFYINPLKEFKNINY